MSTPDSRLEFDNGVLALSTPWASNARGVVLVDGQPVQWPAGRVGPWSVAVAVGGAGELALELVNTGDEPARLGTVHFGKWAPESFSSSLATAPFRELIHGGSFLGIGAGVKCVGRPGLGLDLVCPSNLFTVYQHDGGGALLLGVLPPVGEALTEFVTLHDQPHMEGAFGFELRHVFDCTVEPGGSRRTSPLVAIGGPDGTDLMARFGDLWAERLDRAAPARPRVGWNSWDTYAGAVTRQTMDANIAAGKRLFGDALDVFAIDEGWEVQWGSWAPNAKFDAGLADFCRYAKAQGVTPGVWTAPLLVNTYNPLFFEHPDWFAARDDGQLQTDTYAYGPMAYLDVTRPEVIEHVGGVFRRLREQGFEYFKVDFSHCILNATRFADPGVGRAALIRRAFAAIREAIGDDAYLLSCGTPYESVVGLVDAVRTTGDIHIYWGHVLRNAGGFATRWWMHGKLWNCDPDFLVVRGPETAEPPYGRRHVVTPAPAGGGWVSGREFNESEARVYALLIHLTGGDVVLGDALDQLNDTGVAMLRRVLEPRPAPAVPVDLFTSDQDLPRVWVSRAESDTLVGLFNWTDKPARIDFDPADYGLTGPAADFWTDQPVATWPTRMARRSSIALRFAH